MDEIHTHESARHYCHESDTWEEAWKPLHTALWTEYKAAAPEAVASAFAVLKMANGNFQRSDNSWGQLRT